MMIHGARAAPRRTTAASASRLTASTSPAIPTCSTSRGPDIVRTIHDAVLRRRRRHHDDEHLHRDLDRPGRLRARGSGLRDERRRRAASRARRRATASSPARSARSTSRSRSARTSTTRRSARTRSTRSRRRYAEQIRGLVEGGVDLLLLETIFDTLNAKAAIAAARETAPELPLWISSRSSTSPGARSRARRSRRSGSSIEHAEPLIVGINCSLGAKEMRPYVAELSRIAPCLRSAHPNAGLPNAFGGYDETPEVTSALLREFARGGLPEHRRQLLRLDPGAHARDRRGCARARAASGTRRGAAARAGAASSRSRSPRTRASC